MKSYEDKLINSIFKNAFLNIYQKYQQIILIPFFFLGFYLLFLYHFIYAAFTGSMLNNDLSWPFLFASFFFLSLPGMIIFIVCLSILTNLIYHPIIKNTIQFPISYELILSKIERVIFNIIFPLYLMYIVTLALALKTELKTVVLIVIPFLVLSSFIAKTFNRITFLGTVVLANYLITLQIHYQYLLFLLNFILIGSFLAAVIWTQSSRQEYLLILFGIFIVLNYILKNKINRYYQIQYLFPDSSNKEFTKMLKTHSGIKEDYQVERYLLLRNYRIYTDFYLLCFIVVMLFRFINTQHLATVPFIIALINILGPASLAIREYYKKDFSRFPIKKRRSIFTHLVQSLLVTSFAFMIFILATRELIALSDILIFLIVFFILFLIQLLLRPKLHMQSSLEYFTLYTLLSQIVTLLLFKFKSYMDIFVI